MQLNKRYSNGDTIIEVLFAISIFSLVAVGGLSIMNKGNTITQRALEITLVRQQIDAQAEILRFLNSSYITAFSKGAPTSFYGSSPATPAYRWVEMRNAIDSAATMQVSDFGTTTGECPSLNADSFIFDTSTTNFIPLISTNYAQPTTFSQIRFDTTTNLFIKSDGLWIEAIKPIAPTGDQAGIGYIDFHIRACWVSVGQAAPMTLGTIVRLYEPL